MRNNIYYARILAGMTLQDVANQMGTQHKAVARWELGEAKCRDMEKLAKVLNVNLDIITSSDKYELKFIEKGNK